MTSLSNDVERFRRERALTQQQLALRAGVSRAEISAIENGRSAPSTATALALARALGRPVEDLFSLTHEAPAWAWEPREPCRFWQAKVGERTLRFPVEPGGFGLAPHDGVFRNGSFRVAGGEEPTLVVAGCDPAVGLLARALLTGEGFRLVALTRSSRDALDLLERGLVHAAGLHWSLDSRKDANAAVVARTLGPGFRLLHLARWQEGIALGPRVSSRSVLALRRSRIRWVAREEGSGARRCLDRLLPQRRFRHVARDHRSVATAIGTGFADAGVAVKLVAEEAGLSFLPLQSEDYELCYPEAMREEPAIRALRRALGSEALRRRFGELPGYDVRRMGEERSVARR